MPNIGALAAFSIEQEAAISICEARKEAAVAVMDAHNEAVAAVQTPVASRPWWRMWP